MQAGFSLDYQNIHTSDIYINILFALHKGFEKQVVTTISYLMDCIHTLNDARRKINI